MKPTPITQVRGIGPTTAKLLAQHGLRSAEDLANASVEAVCAVHGFSNNRARAAIRDAAALVVGQEPQPEDPMVAAEALAAEAEATQDGTDDAEDTVVVAAPVKVKVKKPKAAKKDKKGKKKKAKKDGKEKKKSDKKDKKDKKGKKKKKN